MRLGDARSVAQARIDALGAGLVEAHGSLEEAIVGENRGVELLRLLLVGEDLDAGEVSEWIQVEADDLLDGWELAGDERDAVRADLLSMAVRVLLIARLAR